MAETVSSGATISPILFFGMDEGRNAVKVMDLRPTAESWEVSQKQQDDQALAEVEASMGDPKDLPPSEAEVREAHPSQQVMMEPIQEELKSPTLPMHPDLDF